MFEIKSGSTWWNYVNEYWELICLIFLFDQFVTSLIQTSTVVIVASDLDLLDLPFARNHCP